MEEEAVMIEPQIFAPENIQEELRRVRQDRQAFSNPADRATHLRLFSAWLPRILQDAPGIQWDELPSQAMGHLVRTVADHPDAIPIALAVGSAMHGMKRNTLLHVSSMLLTLCRHLRTHFGMTQISQLQERDIWMRFVTGRQLTGGEVRLLTNYASVTSSHLLTYLEHLDERHRIAMTPYVFPPLPARFLELHAQHKASVLAAQARRKEQSDILTPLLPLLIEMAQLRKQAMERLYQAFCTKRAQAQAGQISLPHHFQYTDRSITLTEDAPTIAAVALVERPVTLALTLWTRDTWVEAHPELYGRAVQWHRRRQLSAYATEKNCTFFNMKATSTICSGAEIFSRPGRSWQPLTPHLMKQNMEHLDGGTRLFVSIDRDCWLLPNAVVSGFAMPCRPEPFCLSLSRSIEASSTQRPWRHLLSRMAAG